MKAGMRSSMRSLETGQGAGVARAKGRGLETRCQPGSPGRPQGAKRCTCSLKGQESRHLRSQAPAMGISVTWCFGKRNRAL